MKNVEKNNTIQVSKSLKKQKTKNRELSSLSKTICELQLKNVDLLVITEDPSGEEIVDNHSIQLVNIIEWLNV